jgi:hypothetical protein
MRNPNIVKEITPIGRAACRQTYNDQQRQEETIHRDERHLCSQSFRIVVVKVLKIVSERESQPFLQGKALLKRQGSATK